MDSACVSISLQKLSAGGWPVYGRKFVRKTLLVLSCARNIGKAGWKCYWCQWELTGNWTWCPQRRVRRQELRGIFPFPFLLKYFLLQPHDRKSRFTTLNTRFKKQMLWPLSGDCEASTNSADWRKKTSKNVEAGCCRSLYCMLDSICSHTAGINAVSSVRLVR